MLLMTVERASGPDQDERPTLTEGENDRSPGPGFDWIMGFEKNHRTESGRSLMPDGVWATPDFGTADAR
jgi:hypothetical protein